MTELVVVMVIVGILGALAAIALPRLWALGTDSTAQGTLDRVVGVQQQVARDTGAYVPASDQAMKGVPGVTVGDENTEPKSDEEVSLFVDTWTGTLYATTVSSGGSCLAVRVPAILDETPPLSVTTPLEQLTPCTAETARWTVLFQQ